MFFLQSIFNMQEKYGLKFVGPVGVLNWHEQSDQRKWRDGLA
jgi:hypothetical protein